MKNKLPLNSYRECIKDNNAYCPYAGKNEYGIWCCTIDKIVQIDWYGCTPIEIINKIDLQEVN
jgi:hypothetical protein